MTEYHSASHDKITGFLDFRVSCGFKRKPYQSDFLKFDRRCLENHPGESALSRELVHEWVDDFTDNELSALFHAIDALPPTPREPFLDEIAPMPFRLIYACGLRPNEGRELLEENASLLTGEILVTHTKRNVL